MQTDFEKRYKTKLLEVFKFTIDFLDSHNLRWWAAYGTCIGAVRHHGMIPWDDDIDILMPREDYNKLIELSDEITKNHYTLHSSKYGNTYVPFLKISDNRSTVYQLKSLHVITGIWVDIFPLDYATDETEAIKHCKRFKKLGKCIQRSQTKYDLRDFQEMLFGGHFGTIKDMVINCLYFQKIRAKAFSQFSSFEKQLTYTPMQLAVSYGAGYYVPKFIYNAKWFDGYKIVPFEDFFIRIPSGYDEYLTYCYGDYMTPPPANKQITHHAFYFVDLEKRYSFNDIEERKRKHVNIK